MVVVVGGGWVENGVEACVNWRWSFSFWCCCCCCCCCCVMGFWVNRR